MNIKYLKILILLACIAGFVGLLNLTVFSNPDLLGFSDKNSSKLKIKQKQERKIAGPDSQEIRLKASQAESLTERTESLDLFSPGKISPSLKSSKSSHDESPGEEEAETNKQIQSESEQSEETDYSPFLGNLGSYDLTESNKVQEFNGEPEKNSAEGDEENLKETAARSNQIERVGGGEIKDKTTDKEQNNANRTKNSKLKGSPLSDKNSDNRVAVNFPKTRTNNLLLNQNNNLDTQGFKKTENRTNPVSGLRAVSSDSKIGLVWDKNTSVKIFISDVDYPAEPSDGIEVYSGAGNNAVITRLDNEITYYFSAFSFDASGNHSVLQNGSKALATPHRVSLSGSFDVLPDEIVSFDPLDSSGAYGMELLADTVLSLPKGAGEWMGSMEVVSLNALSRKDAQSTSRYGGSITLKFTDNIVYNGQGDDFTVFENAFHVEGTDSYIRSSSNEQRF